MVSQTLLPMPTGMENIYQAQQEFNFSRGEVVDLDIKTAIEGVVIKWAQVCTDILKETSRIMFAEGQQPTPFREVEFWNARLKNLENIYDQLRDPRVKKMILYLECTKSTYLSCFKSIFKDVVAAIVEARNICLYMKPMVKHFAHFEENDFLDNENAVRPLVHCCGLLWANSRYYCSTTKIVTLLQMIGNLLIESATKQLDPSSVFQGEADDVYKKFDKAVQILELFKSSFEIVRMNLETYFPEDIEPKPWNFHPRSVFQRLMNFIDRLKLVRQILETNLEFTKLEKVEIGGLRGRGLSMKCNEVFEEFNTLYNVFRNIQYDILDPEDRNIEADNAAFESKCLDLDRRLAAIFSQAFDDCHNLDAIFKLLNVIGKLIERPLIRDEVTVKYPIILDMFNAELDLVKVLFDQCVNDDLPIDNYFAPISGHLVWLHKLRERIRKPGESFLLIQNSIVQSEAAQYMLKKREQMLDLIDEREAMLFNEWCAVTPGKISALMSKFILVKKPDKLLKHNFDDELIAILREIRYLKLLNIENMPEAIDEFFIRDDDLYEQLCVAKRIVEYYNHLRTNTIKEEFDLIQNEVDNVDAMVVKLTDELVWDENCKVIFIYYFKT